MQTPKKILVIEDERPLIAAITKKLEINNFSVLGARSVKEALKKLSTQKVVDLIWLDHYLFGKEDGLFFVSEIKKRKEWTDIPIFLVTNTAGSDKVMRYLALGINKYYIKSEAGLDEIICDIKNFLAGNK